eukprot:5093202-Prymnesium_polylepis.2
MAPYAIASVSRREVGVSPRGAITNSVRSSSSPTAYRPRHMCTQGSAEGADGLAAPPKPSFGPVSPHRVATGGPELQLASPGRGAFSRAGLSLAIRRLRCGSSAGSSKRLHRA